MHSSDYVFTDYIPDRDNPHPHVPELIVIHHDSDFSGTVIVNLEAWRVSEEHMAPGQKRNGQNIVEVLLPFEVIAKLVSEAVLSKRIRDIEESDYRKILGL